jgi:proline iminopeptidase
MRSIALVLFALTQFTAPDGVTLHYSTMGSGAPVIVLSGGPGLSIEYMMPVGRDVSRHAKAIMLEQRGTGHSSLEKLDASTLSIAKEVEDIDALRAHLGVEKIRVLGHSWGGMLAMAYAAAHPDRVAKLILVEPGGPTLDFGPAFVKRLEAKYTGEELDEVAYWQGHRAAAKTLAVKTPAYFYDPRKAREFVKLISEESYNPRVNGILFGEMLKKFDLREGLRAVTAPVVVIQSRQDPLNALDDIRKAMPQAKVIWIDHAGHYPWVEQPAAFRRAISAAFRTDPY